MEEIKPGPFPLSSSRASMSARCVSGVIDLAVSYGTSIVLGIAVALVRPIPSDGVIGLQRYVGSALAVMCLLGVIVSFFIWPVAVGRATVGQKIVGIRIMRWRSDNGVGFGLSILRLILASGSIPITLIMAMREMINPTCDVKVSTWYDNLTKTCVVLDPGDNGSRL